MNENEIGNEGLSPREKYANHSAYSTKRSNSSKAIGGRICRAKNNKGLGTTIGGLTRAIAERLCKYVFVDYFMYIQRDTQNLIWKVALYQTVDGVPLDDDVIKYFLEFWNEEYVEYFKIIRIPENLVLDDKPEDAR